MIRTLAMRKSDARLVMCAGGTHAAGALGGAPTTLAGHLLGQVSGRRPASVRRAREAATALVRAPRGGRYALPTMRTVILCGGKGTRAYPHTLEVPKPLLEVDDRRCCAHLMEIYAAQGFTDFVLAAGYKLPLVEEFASELPGGVGGRGGRHGRDDQHRRARAPDRGPRQATTSSSPTPTGLGNVDLAALLELPPRRTRVRRR